MSLFKKKLSVVTEPSRNSFRNSTTKNAGALNHPEQFLQCLSLLRLSCPRAALWVCGSRNPKPQSAVVGPAKLSWCSPPNAVPRQTAPCNTPIKKNGPSSASKDVLDSDFRVAHWNAVDELESRPQPVELRALVHVHHAVGGRRPHPDRVVQEGFQSS